MLIPSKLVFAAAATLFCRHVIILRREKVRRPLLKEALLLLGVFALCSVPLVLIDLSFSYLFFALPASFGVCFLLMDGKPLSKAVLAALLFLMTAALWFLSGLLAERGTSAHGFALSCSLLVVSALVPLLDPKLRSRHGPLIGLIASTAAAILILTEYIRMDSPVLIGVLLSLWLVYCAALLALTSEKLRASMEQARNEKLLEQHYAMQEEYYEKLYERQEQTRALWHDMEKYLRAADAEKAASVSFKQAGRLLADATNIVDVGNRVLNVILNEYKAKAEAARIDLSLHVQVPPELDVSVADLYVLLGNTLDNAIEAVAPLPPDRRSIELSLKAVHDMLYYRLINPIGDCSGTKREGHGYGLKNVRACVEKYGGSMETEHANGCFTFSAHLNITQRKS